MNIYENFQLSEILYYKIGGKAKYVLKIQNYEDLSEALAFVKKNNISRILPVGLGANLLMTDNFFDGAVLWFAKPDEVLITHHDQGLVESFPSHLLDDLILFSFKHDLIGVEWAGGLPSTIGGAVRGNVGAFGNEIKQVVEKVEVIDISKGNEVLTLTNEEMDFSYRSSIIKNNPHLIISRVFFRFNEGNQEQIEEAQNTYFSKIEHRKKHNPVEYPSCGSTFKNITEKENIEKILAVWPDITEKVETAWHGKVSMGYSIKRLGLAGYTLGSGQISEKHANYLINLGGAHFEDIYQLIKKIQDTFYETFGFYPEPEVQIVQ